MSVIDLVNVTVGGVQPSSLTPGEMNLTQDELDTFVSAAIAQWAAAGASASQLASLYDTHFTVGDLPGIAALSEVTSPGHITIDIDAAGYGWFIDPTPSDNLEFPHAQDAAGTYLLTDPSSDAAGHIDLLSVVTRELGRVLGLGDSTSPGDPDDLMYFNLLVGERRIPDPIDIALAPTTTLTPTISLGPLDPSVSIGPTDGPNGTGNPGNDIIHDGPAGRFLFGGGADTFVFADVNLNAAQPWLLKDYSYHGGGQFDFSALTSQFHATDVSDAMIMRTVEDGSSQFAAAAHLTQIHDGLLV